MEPLRILFICPYLPSLIRVRPYNLIQYLAGRGHQITLLALEPPGEDTSGLPALRQWCAGVQTVRLSRWRTIWNGLTALPGRTPFQAAYSRSPAIAGLIRQVQADLHFDVVHVEHLRGAELSRAVRDAPVVFDSVDSISLLFEHVRRAGPTRRSRLLAQLDLTRTRDYEGRLLERYPRILVTSTRDRDALAELAGCLDRRSTRLVQPVNPVLESRRAGRSPGPDNRLVVLPNGVDLVYFKPWAGPRDPATLIFTGKMSYHANVAAALDLAHQVMPFVWQECPEARLVLAGKDPPPELLALTTDSRISVTGTVPDLRPFLGQATISVLPMRYGVGIQNKVLEALAMATPVVSSSQAVSALQVVDGQEVMLADNPQAMARAVVALLANEAQRRQIGAAGRHYVETHHDWGVVAARLETVYRDAMAAVGL